MQRMKFYALCAAVAFVSLFPQIAFSIQEIEFYVDNRSASEQCFQCTGPFSRRTPRVTIFPGSVYYFYTADVNALSPYGNWFCHVYFTDNCSEDEPVSEENTLTQIIYISPAMASVNLMINGTGPGDTTIVIFFPGLQGAVDGTPVSVMSFLGDDPRPGKGDNDTFSFEADGGEEVTIKLEPDPSAGHVGEGATLRLRPARGGSPLLVRNEKLPFEATVTIPEAGTYQIVLQSDVPDNMLLYRGGYILSLDSDSDGINTLHPSDNVEN